MLRDEVVERIIFSFIGDAEAVPLVEILLRARGPAEIPALVVSVVVDAVDLAPLCIGPAHVPDCPHVVDEREGVAELLGQPDAPGSIVAVLAGERVFASAADREPLAPNPLVDFIWRPPPHVLLPPLRRRLPST